MDFEEISFVPVFGDLSKLLDFGAQAACGTCPKGCGGGGSCGSCEEVGCGGD